jgi:putative endonuclease
MESFVVYIIYSESIDSYYIGQTSNLQERLYRHCNSGSKSTKKAKDWKLVYKEEYNSRSESVQREREIKNKKSRKYIEQLISSAG